jgi:hypothetical protein
LAGEGYQSTSLAEGVILGLSTVVGAAVSQAHIRVRLLGCELPKFARDRIIILEAFSWIRNARRCRVRFACFVHLRALRSETWFGASATAKLDDSYGSV